MTTPLNRPTAEVTVAGETVLARAGEITLDWVSVPYGKADLDIPLLDLSDVEALDPRDVLRAVVVAGDDVVASSRTFDLSVRSREVSHDNKTIRLGLATDESLLMAYQALTLDTGARAHEGSLRDVIDYVLDTVIPGAALDATPSVDADVTAYWEVTNTVLNPRSQTTTNYEIGSTGTNLTTGSTSPAVGSAYVRWDSTGAGNTFLRVLSDNAVSAGTRVTTWANLRGSAAIQGGMMIRFVNADGDRIVDRYGTTSTLATGTGWTQVSHSTIAPVGAAQYQLYAYAVSVSGSETIALSGCMGYLNDEEIIPFFSGSTATDANYSYEWADAANASASKRIPFVDRPPEVFNWEPGTSAWAFLEPLIDAAGLALFCDESRVWRLVQTAEYVLPGAVVWSPANTTRGNDTITLDDPEVYATGVVVVYKWTDRYGIDRTRTDSAGSPGRVLRFELARPWPGPGAAAAILARRDGQGRVQEVTTLAQWDASPTMQATISLPGTDDQLGQIEAVTWGITDGLMDVRTRALVDVVPGSVAALTGTIDSLAGTIDSF